MSEPQRAARGPQRRMGENDITAEVIGAAIDVHRELGPGLLESSYEACLVHELIHRGVRLERQKRLPVHYRGVRIDCGYRLDLVLEGKVIVELKAVVRVLAIHRAQMLTYLKLSALQVGLILNFHTLRMKDGVHRYVHQLAE